MNRTPPKPSRLHVHLAAPDRLIWVAVVAVVLWGLWAFSSELMLNLRLNRQVDAMRARNAQLADANGQARRELADADSRAALETAARQQGYVRRGESSYIVTGPSPQAGPRASADAITPEQASNGVWDSIVRWWRNRWH